MIFSKKFCTSILGVAALASAVSCSSIKPEHQVPATVVETEATDEAYNRIPAADCDKSKYKECKEARKNDIATRYMLDYSGTLSRKINNAVCAVTGNVESFKISQHPNDVAVLYYKKDGDLYLVNLDKEYRPNGQCPSAKGNTKKIMSSVKKYTVTPNVHSQIVNVALDNNGKLNAWDNTKVVYSDSQIETFTMNECFGSGKSFSSYVLFSKDYSGHATKVKGNYSKDGAKGANESYESILKAACK